MKQWVAVAMLAVLPITINAQSSTTPATPAPAAQPLPDMSLRGRLESQYVYVRDNVAKMADKMPADAYAFQATPEVKTFAANMGHIIRSNAAQCSNLLGRKHDLAGQDLEKTLTAKADIVKALKDATAFCDEYFMKMTTEQLVNGAFETFVTRDGQKIPVKAPHLGIVAAFLGHNNEMYGYMSVYMRLKGIVPPSSDRTPAK